MQNTIEIKGGKPGIVFIHGYTGSPTDFVGLENILNRRYGSSIDIPLLPGHGTKPSDLLELNYDDLYDFMKKWISNRDKKVVLIGYSLGAHIALQLASEYKVLGVIAIAPPLKFKFPFNLSFIIKIIQLKKYYNKRKSIVNKKQLAGGFFYNKLPSAGFTITNKGIKEVNPLLSKIKCPCLFLQTTDDWMVDNLSFLKKTMPSAEIVRFKSSSFTHNMFFPPYRNKMFKEITKFLDRTIQT